LILPLTVTTKTMTKGLFMFTFAALVGSANAAGAVELTQENFADLTKGKNSFVKFLAPW